MSGDMPADSGPGRQPVGGKAAHTCLAPVKAAHGRAQRAHGPGWRQLLRPRPGRPTPAPPWKLSWSDDFSGPADSGVNPKYWEYNTGRGVFGTNEIETMTPSKYNVHLDGHGNLDIIVLGHGAAGNPKAAWTSGRIETRANRLFERPPAAR